jgi:hypothetical protein
MGSDFFLQAYYDLVFLFANRSLQLPKPYLLLFDRADIIIGDLIELAAFVQPMIISLVDLDINFLH